MNCDIVNVKLKVWKAKWIMDEWFYGLIPINVFHKQNDKAVLPEHRADLKNLHMLVRKNFNCNEATKRAYLDITADDYYKLYINGRYVGQGPAPSYYFHYNYNRIDIAEFLKKGENTIAVHIYYQGLLNRVWNSADYRQGMVAELFVNDKLHLVSDSTWKYTHAKEFTGGDTVGYDTQFLENIDNRLKEVGWKETGYDDSMWKPACVNICDDHKLILQSTPPLQVYEIAPVSIKNLSKGHYLIDFGHELAGQFKMEAEGLAGQSIEIRCGEELSEKSEFHVRHEMRCNCNYRETWILSGGKDVLEFYDYKAFRYVEVIAPDGGPKPEGFAAVVRHYPLDEKSMCTFVSSDNLLNNIWSICKNGIRYGVQEGFLDCPSREKGQYLCDATITSKSHSYISGDLRLYRKMLGDFARSSFICPGLMGVSPGSYMQEVADSSLQLPLQLLNYYMFSGDFEFLNEMYPIIERMVTYFKKFERPDGLLENVNEKWNMTDWPQNLRDGYDFDLSQPNPGEGCHNVINAYYCGAIKILGEIKKILGMEPGNEFSRLKKAYINAFYNKENELFVDSTVSAHSALHSNALALFYGLVPEEAVESVVDLIRKKRLSCGVYFSYFVLKGLCGAGYHDLVFDLIMSEEEHSWANMIREGATTCFEAWGKEQKWNTSLCHPWASAPIPVFIEDIIGLKPAKPGWEEINFFPNFPKQLKYFKLQFHIAKGMVSICFNDGIVDIRLPEGVRLLNTENGFSR